MYIENDFVSWMWIILLFICSLTFFYVVFYDRKLLNSKRLEDMDETAKPKENILNICTSLSCVRCSSSVFSTEKLLSKWSVIKETLQPDDKTCQKINNGILNLKNSSSIKLSEQASTVFHLEGILGKVWYTAQDYTKEVLVLERNISDIISEFFSISQNMDVGWVSNTVPSGGWFLFHLVNQGVRIKENCQRCPKTMKLIEQLPLVMSDCVFGNIMFSVLLPGTRIAEHCGPTNVRIRCHVPITIPDGYFIRVAGEERTWIDNQVLIFDDSFYHEVYDYGNGIGSRVVLMVDFWHPKLNYKEKEIIQTLFSPHSTFCNRGD